MANPNISLKISLSALALCAGLSISSRLASADPPPPQQLLPKAGSEPKATGPAAPKFVVPDTAANRAKLLRNLYAELATADSEQSAAKLSQQIERVWLTPASETVGVLMERASKAAAGQRFDLALNLLEAATRLAPDYAEVWNRRAYVHYLSNDFVRAVGDLRRALALDPDHFKALDGLGQIFKELGQKQAALDVYRKLLAVNPFWSGGEQVVDELTREVDGRTL